MNQWSTLALSMGLFRPAIEAFRDLHTPENLKAAMPYPLTRVEDMVFEMQIGGPLSAEFHEDRYYIMKGPMMVVALDTAFHRTEGLVNFSFKTLTLGATNLDTLRRCVRGLSAETDHLGLCSIDR